MEVVGFAVDEAGTIAKLFTYVADRELPTTEGSYDFHLTRSDIRPARP